MIEKNLKRLALFDFDGTLTYKDSLFVFLRFFKGRLYFIKKLLISLPIILAYKLGFVSGSKAKEKLLSNFLKGTKAEEFRVRCDIFAKNKIPQILNQDIVNKFHQHIANGDKVVIVSASLTDWILPWAKQWHVEVLATKLLSEKGVLMGKFDGKNCNNDEKVIRIKNHLDLAGYDEIFAYGDSKGDEPMLGLATQVYFKGVLRKS